MPFDDHANFAASTVATAPSPADTGLSLVVAAGEGSRFPAAPFNAVVWPTGTDPTQSSAEIVRVTAKSTDTFTIVRTQEGSSSRSIVVGDNIMAAVTDKTLTDIESFGSWQRYVDESGASFANWTGLTGTWASDGTNIQQTNGATATSQRAYLQTPRMPPWYIAQVEFRIPSVGAIASQADQHIGILVWSDGANGSGRGLVRAFAVSNANSFTCQVEQDATSARVGGSGVAGTYFDTWHTIRAVVAPKSAGGWVDGAGWTGMAGNLNDYNNPYFIGLLTYNIKADFRNLRVWTPNFAGIPLL